MSFSFFICIRKELCGPQKESSSAGVGRESARRLPSFYSSITLSGPFNDSQSHNYLVKIPKCPFQQMKLLITPFSHINCSSPLLWCLPCPSSRKPSYHIFELFCTFLDIIFHTLLSKLFLTLISFVEHCQ